VRHRKDLGARKHERIEYRRPGYIVPAPDAPWIECFILDVSESGICLEVGALAIPQIFGGVLHLVWCGYASVPPGVAQGRIDRGRAS
jgi:hypothetical protein